MKKTSQTAMPQAIEAQATSRNVKCAIVKPLLEGAFSVNIKGTQFRFEWSTIEKEYCLQRRYYHPETGELYWGDVFPSFSLSLDELYNVSKEDIREAIRRSNEFESSLPNSPAARNFVQNLHVREDMDIAAQIEAFLKLHQAYDGNTKAKITLPDGTCIDVYNEPADVVESEYLF